MHQFKLTLIYNEKTENNDSMMNGLIFHLPILLIASFVAADSTFSIYRIGLDSQNKIKM